MSKSSDRAFGKRLSLEAKLVDATVRQHPFITISVGLFFLWLGLLFQAPAFLDGQGDLSLSLIASWALFVSVYSLGYLAMLCSYRRLTRLFESRLWSFAACGLMELGGVLNAALAGGLLDFGSLRPIVSFAATAIMCVGTSFIMPIGASAQYYTGSRNAVALSMVGMVGSSALLIVISILGPCAKLVAILAIPLVLPFTTNASYPSKASRKRVFEHGLDTKRPLVPYKLLLTAMIHGASFGSLILFVQLYPDSGSTLLFNALWFLVGMLFVFALVFLFRRDYNSLIYRCSLPYIALGLLLVCLQGFGIMVGCSLIALGYAFLHVVMCGVCAYLVRQFDIPTLWVLCLTTLFFAMGQVVGVVLIGVGIAKGVSLSVLAATGLFGVLVAALYLSTDVNVRYGWGIVRPSESIEENAAIPSAVRLLATERNLTTRESEVIALAAQGMARKEIASALVLSEDTIKSHVRHAYAKLGISSKQELIELVQGKAARKRRGE